MKEVIMVLIVVVGGITVVGMAIWMEFKKIETEQPTCVRLIDVEIPFILEVKEYEETNK